MDEDFLIKKQTLSAIKRIEIASAKMSGVISLAQGVPSTPSENSIRETVINAIRSGKTDKYSAVTGIPILRSAIKKDLDKNRMGHYSEDEIVVTAGATESLSSIIFSLVKPNDEVIIITPAYPNYQRIIKIAKAKVVEVQLNEKKNWDLNLENVKSKISQKTKAIIICNPNNPTGSIIENKKLVKLAEISQNQNVNIIIDDIYRNLNYTNNPLENLCQRKKFKPNIIRIVSFSKEFSLSGWRIGYIHGPKEKINKIVVIHDNIINCAPVVSQYAALAAIKNKEKIIEKNLKIYKENRKIMGDWLEHLNKFIQFSWPQGTYYFFPKIIGTQNSEDLAFDILDKVKLAVVPGKDFGIGGESHIRLCFGRSKAKIIEGMKRLEYYFQKYYEKFQKTQKE